MIGKIYSSIFPYYDIHTNTKSFKKRPVLIISDSRNNDFTVLPISTVSKKENLDSEYDFKICPADYPQLNLQKVSYIRVHKQTTVHKKELGQEISDFKAEYEEAFLEVLILLEQFNRYIQGRALA